MIPIKNIELSFYSCYILIPLGSMVCHRKSKVHGTLEDIKTEIPALLQLPV